MGRAQFFGRGEARRSTPSRRTLLKPGQHVPQVTLCLPAARGEARLDAPRTPLPFSPTPGEVMATDAPPPFAEPPRPPRPARVL